MALVHTRCMNPSTAQIGPPQGRDTTTSAPPSEEVRLSRGAEGRFVAGVCVGLADYFDIDPTLVRIAFVVMTLLGGLAVPLYLACWLMIPAQGAQYSVAEETLGP